MPRNILIRIGFVRMGWLAGVSWCCASFVRTLRHEIWLICAYVHGKARQNNFSYKLHATARPSFAATAVHTDFLWHDLLISCITFRLLLNYDFLHICSQHTIWSQFFLRVWILLSITHTTNFVNVYILWQTKNKPKSYVSMQWKWMEEKKLKIINWK